MNNKNEVYSIKNAQKQSIKRLIDMAYSTNGHLDVSLLVSTIIFIAYKHKIDFFESPLFTIGYQASFKERFLQTLQESIGNKSKYGSDLASQCLERLFSTTNEDFLSFASDLITNTHSSWQSFYEDVFFNLINQRDDFKTKNSQQGYATSQLICDQIASFYENAVKSQEGLKQAKKISILDLGSGIGKLTREISKSNFLIDRIKCIDSDPTQTLLGRMYLDLCGISSVIYECMDINDISLYENQSKYDFVVADPPFGLKSDSLAFRMQNPKWFPSKKIENAFVTTAIDNINAGGAAAIVVPDGFMFSTDKSSLKIRSYLIGNDILEYAVSLPVGVMKPYSGVNVSLLLINTNKANDKKGFVTFKKLNVTDESVGINTSLHNNIIHSEETTVLTSDISANGYKFSVGTYIAKDKFHQFSNNKVTISDVILSYNKGQYIDKESLSKNGSIPYVTIKDLPIDGSALTLNIEKVSRFIDISYQKSRLHFIKPNSVLLALTGDKLRPAIFDNSQRAVCSHHIICLEVNSNKILPEYLILQLSSSYVQDQLFYLRTGTISSLPVAQLKNIWIDCPSLDVQSLAINSAYAVLLEKSEERLEVSLENEIYNQVSHLNHALKQPLAALKSSIKNINTYLLNQANTGRPIELSDITISKLGQNDEELFDFRLDEVVKRLSSHIERAQKVLSQNEDWLNISNGKINRESFDIVKIINTEILPLYKDEKCSIKLSRSTFKAVLDKNQITIMLQNVIDNALKHGFKGREEKTDNVIEINLERVHEHQFLSGRYEDSILIQVRNNGLPPKKGFNATWFTANGMTTNRNEGSGFGGHLIGKVVSNHKGDVLVTPTEELEFSQFRVELNIFIPES